MFTLSPTSHILLAVKTYRLVATNRLLFIIPRGGGALDALSFV
jgi:hypothetical protein